MALDQFSSIAGRSAAKAAGFDTKVAVPSSKPSMGKTSQPITGKLKGMEAMPGSKGKGQAVKTVKSNPISGSANAQKGNTAMGSGSVINGFVG